MDKTIVVQLQRLGLSEKEAMAYLVLLSINEATVNEVAKAARLTRSTTYILLDSLKKRGFVESRYISDILRYSALPPEKLVQAAEKGVIEAESVTETVRFVAEELEKDRAEATHSPYTTYFDTEKGLRNLRHETENLKEGIILRALLHSALGTEKLSSSSQNRLIVATDHNILTSDMFGETPLRFIPKFNYSFSSDFFIFDETIILISDEEEFAVRVESREFAEAMSEAFDLAWEEAGNLDAGIRRKKPTKETQRRK